MLVIRRRVGESFLIGDQVEVQILEISSSQVKLGIEAPREVTVLRKEIQLTSRQNQEAARMPQADMLSKLLGKLNPADRLNNSEPDRSNNSQ